MMPPRSWKVLEASMIRRDSGTPRRRFEQGLRCTCRELQGMPMGMAHNNALRPWACHPAAMASWRSARRRQCGVLRSMPLPGMPNMSGCDQRSADQPPNTL